MQSGARGGIPDNYYRSPYRALWVEMKFDSTPPKTINLTKRLTPLQQRTLTQLHENNEHVAVLYATPSAFTLIEGDNWQTPIPKEHLIPMKSSTCIAKVLQKTLICAGDF